MIAIKRYDDQISAFCKDVNVAYQFLNYMARHHKYPFDDQVQFFAYNQNANLIASYGQWENLKRPVQARERAMRIINLKTKEFTNCFDVTQTNGNDVKVFNWEINELDQKNLNIYWSQNNPELGNSTSFTNKLDSFMFKQFSLQTNQTYQLPPDERSQILTCAKFLINKRMDMITPTLKAKTWQILHKTTDEENFKQLLRTSQNIARQTTFAVEKILQKNIIRS